MTDTPTRTPTDAALERAAELGRAYVAGLPDRRVGTTATLEELRSRFTGPLPEDGEPRQAVVEHLAPEAEPGLIGMAGPRFFGFVIGGSMPAALAADWLTSRLGPERRPLRHGPAAAVAEEAAGAWLRDLFDLPPTRQRGLHDRRHDGPVHRARRGTPRGPAPGRLGRRAAGLFGAPEIDGRRERRVARHDLRGAGAAGPRAGPRDPHPDRRAGPDARRCPGAGPRRPRPPGARRRPGRERQHGRLRPAAGDRPRVRANRRLAARRRRVRAVGPRGPSPAAPRRRRGGRRLLDHRRPQVAQRPVRLRPGAAPTPRRTRRRCARRRVLRGDRGPGARQLQLGAGVLAACPRVHVWAALRSLGRQGSRS